MSELEDAKHNAAFWKAEAIGLNTLLRTEKERAADLQRRLEEVERQIGELNLSLVNCGENIHEISTQFLNAHERAAELQARLDRVERENRELKEGWRQAKMAIEAATIELCAQECERIGENLSYGAGYALKTGARYIRALSAQNAAAEQETGREQSHAVNVSKDSADTVPALSAAPIVAHSKSMYRRLSTQGANVVPPAAPNGDVKR